MVKKLRARHTIVQSIAHSILLTMRERLSEALIACHLALAAEMYLETIVLLQILSACLRPRMRNFHYAKCSFSQDIDVMILLYQAYLGERIIVCESQYLNKLRL